MKLDRREGAIDYDPSHSARSAWIETANRTRDKIPEPVALRKECVD